MDVVYFLILYSALSLTEFCVRSLRFRNIYFVIIIRFFFFFFHLRARNQPVDYSGAYIRGDVLYCENSEHITYLGEAGVPVFSFELTRAKLSELNTGLEVTHATQSELNTSPTWVSGCLC